MGFPQWEEAHTCTGAPSRGALALMRWFVENYNKKGGYNLGIYNCRSVRGASTTSCHGEGRALDLGFPVGDPDGDALLRRLLKAPGRLGIQAIIYERRIYSAKSPGGRPYTGLVPHTDHLHVELTREAASSLTYATVKAVMASTLVKPHKAGSRTLRVGMKGEDVKFVQKVVDVKQDGEYGPKTREAVKIYESRLNHRYPKIVVDGVVGKLTWKAMGVNPSY